MADHALIVNDDRTGFTIECLTPDKCDGWHHPDGRMAKIKRRDFR